MRNDPKREGASSTSPDYRVGGRPGFRLEDDSILPRDGHHLPHLADPPRLVIDKRAGDLPYDLEDYFGFGWFPTEQKP